jgi:hypothetical protein
MVMISRSQEDIFCSNQHVAKESFDDSSLVSVAMSNEHNFGRVDMCVHAKFDQECQCVFVRDEECVFGDVLSRKRHDFTISIIHR